MKKILTALLLTAITTTAYAGAGWHRKLDAAQAEAKSKNRLILVDMFADWCGWCHRIEREVFPSEAFQNASSELVLLRLDTEDRGEGTRMSTQWGVTSLPTFVMLTPELEIVGFIQGYAPAAPFSARVTELIEGQRRYRALVAKGDATTAGEKLELSTLLAARKRYGDAEAVLTKLIASKPSAAVAARARYQLAVAQFEQRKFDIALRSVNSLLSAQLEPSMAEEATFLRGSIYIEQANLPAALTEFKAFRRNYPRSARIPAVDRVLPQLERAIASQ